MSTADRKRRRSRGPRKLLKKVCWCLRWWNIRAGWLETGLGESIAGDVKGWLHKCVSRDTGRPEGFTVRSEQAGLMIQGQFHEVQQGQVPGPALHSQQPHATLQGWGRVAGKLPKGKGPWSAGQQLAEHEPAVCPGGQEGQQHPGFYQEWCGQQE